ncbi:MAG TPA: hypothetical protein VMU65_11810 [Candidatus Saccharimonadales bacterium]|nr:hypothetical protein [Candidatus Saccharimonadales bacterium]
MAHFVDNDPNNLADAFLKSVKADPIGWRRRLGIHPVDEVAMNRKIAELRAKLRELEAMAPPPRLTGPPPLHRQTAANGHSNQPRRTS